MNLPAPRRFHSLTQWRREALREPQAAIAKRSKLSQSHLSKIERGHRPKPWLWAALAHAYRLNEAECLRLIDAAQAAWSPGPLWDLAARHEPAPVADGCTEPRRKAGGA